MAVTEVIKGLGNWSVTLKGVPQDILDAIRHFGHISIHTGDYDYRVAGDSALTSSRYTGVVRKKEGDGNSLALGGASMAVWLGDEDKKGDVYETLMSFTATTFENTIRALLPVGGSVIEGTLFNIGQNFTGNFVFQSPREAIEYVCDTLGAEYIVRGDGRIDAGLISDLFSTNPKAILVRQAEGTDMALRALLGQFKTSQDVEDFTTRAVLLANGTAGALVSAAVNINPGLNPYRDIRGNPVKMTRLISESATDTGNATARAQLALNQFTSTKDAITLSSSDYDIKGDLTVGDYIWIQDPELGLVDGNNEVLFRGERYNPMKLRLTEMTWGIPKGMSVGYRDWVGKWFNLTEYLVPESAGNSTLVVGGYTRSSNTGADGGVGGSRPIPDTSIPGVPTWTTPFINSVYQSVINGETKAQTQLKWTRPNNVDGSSIVDGDHYEIRWRNGTTPIFPSTHAQMAVFTHAQLNLNGGTYGQPIVYPAGPWNYAVAPWSELTMLLQELAPSMPYEAQIRAVDGATPANAGAWSLLTAFQTSGDTLPPAVPAPPTVAASRMAVQIVHTLGRQSGGTYNLDADLHHFDVHGEYEPNFTPGPTTLLGKIVANNGMIVGHIPAVGSVQIERVTPTYFKVIAVDNSGNNSEPSTAVQATALLIDDAHISDLTVSKVTAGTIQADWINAARITTALSGVRTEMAYDGFRAVDAAGVETFRVDSATGNLDAIGEIASAPLGSSKRVVVNQRVGGSNVPEIRMYPTSGSVFGYINSIAGTSGSSAGVGINSSTVFGPEQTTVWCHSEYALIGRMTASGPFPFRGGYSWYTDTFAVMGVQFPAGGVDAKIQVSNDYNLSFRGMVRRNNGFDGGLATMFTVWTDDIPNSVQVMVFAATMAANPCVVATWANFGNTNDPNNTQAAVQNFTPNGFSVRTNSGVAPPAAAAGQVGRFSVWVFQTL